MSPDLAPMENVNVWQVLKMNLRKKDIKTYKSLVSAINYQWRVEQVTNGASTQIATKYKVWNIVFLMLLEVREILYYIHDQHLFCRCLKYNSSTLILSSWILRRGRLLSSTVSLNIWIGGKHNCQKWLFSKHIKQQ